METPPSIPERFAPDFEPLYVTDAKGRVTEEIAAQSAAQTVDRPQPRRAAE